MAGTIRVITTKPNSEGFSGRISADVTTLDSSDDNGSMIRGLLNVPIIEDQLAIRLVAGYTKTPGWIDVPDLGLKDVNDTEQADFRGSLRWTPSDTLTVDASITYQDLKIGSTYGATEPGLMDPQGQFPPSGNVASLSPNDTDYLIGNLTIAYDFSFASLVSATSYFDQDRTAFFDISPFLPLFFGPGTGGTTDNPGETTNKLWSQEFRLVSNDAKRVGWTVGA